MIRTQIFIYLTLALNSFTHRYLCLTNRFSYIDKNKYWIIHIVLAILTVVKKGTLYEIVVYCVVVFVREGNVLEVVNPHIR